MRGGDNRRMCSMLSRSGGPTPSPGGGERGNVGPGPQRGARGGSRGRIGVVVAALLGGLVLIPSSSAAGAIAPRIPTRAAAFDNDPFEVSGGGARVTGSVSWSRGGDPRDVRGRISGRLRSAEGGCSQVLVSWANASNSTLDASSEEACGGASGGFGFSFASSALECVRVELTVRGSRVGPTRLLCAGGS